MEKLRPIIRQRFWILFGLAIPLALAGYFMTSGEMTAATDSREKSLTDTINGVPKGDTEPNGTYAAGLQEINAELKEDNKIEVQKLWEGQKSRMHWPTVMVKNNYIPNEYRGEIENAARLYYVQIYGDVVKRVWEKAQPVVDDPPPYGLEVTWEPKLLLMPETIPIHDFPANVAPSNKQVWDAQEDVWLLELIFDGIVRTNKGASWIGDAPVRSVEQLFLIGGNNQPVLMDAGATGGGAGPGAGASPMAGFNGLRQEDEESGLGGLGAIASLGGNNRRGGGMMGGQIGFSPVEEFGMPVIDPEVQKEMEAAGAATPGGFGGLDKGDQGDSALFGGVGAGMAGPAQMGGGLGQNAMAGMYRYIGEPTQVESQPYRERGFYMSAIVMLPELPNFFAEMSSSDWPIRIMRFQIGPNPHAPKDNAMPGSLMAGMGRPGFGRFGGGRTADEAEDYGGGFGAGGLGGLRSRRSTVARTFGSGNRSDDDTGGRGFGFGGRSGLGGLAGGGVVLPNSMQGPSYIDPNWLAHPDLVQVDFCGIITMYNPQTDDTLVPTGDGSSEEATPEAIAEREEEAIKVAEEAAAAEAEAAEAEAAANPPAGETPADAAATGDPPSPSESPADPAAPVEAPAESPAADSVPPTDGEPAEREATTEAEPATNSAPAEQGAGEQNAAEQSTGEQQ